MSDNDNLRPIPKDSLMVMTAGEYSSFGIYGVCRALRDITVEDQRRAVEESHGDVFAYFNRMGWVEEHSYFEVWVDDYGNQELIVTLHERGDNEPAAR